jgi:Flp pilus assembly protein TadD
MITITTSALAALLLAGAQADQSAPAPTRAEPATLAADQLAKGRTVNAIAALEKHVEAAPEDPALLINLGIAHAQAGDNQKARRMFQRALVSPEPTQLETAEGDTIDSRRLARKAMRMLERGEFAARISRRD